MIIDFFQNYRTSNFFLIIVQPVFYGAMHLAQQFDERRIYLIFYTFVACILLAGVSLLFSSPSPIYSPEHSSLLDLDDTSFQRRVYLLCAVALFIVPLILGLARRQISFPYLSAFRIKHWLVLETLVAGVLLFIALPLFFNLFGTITDKRTFLMVLGSLALFYILLRCVSTIKGIVFITLLTVAVFFFFFILPLQASLVVADNSLWGLDHHWTGVIGHGLMAAALPEGTSAALPEYGIYLNKLVSQAASLPLFESFAGTIRFLQLTHLVFACMVFGVLVQRFGSRNLPLAMIAFILVLLILAPSMAGSAPTVNAPNQSPLRFLFLPITLLFSPLIAKRPLFIWWGASAILTGIAVSYNLEIGLICGLGLGFALFVRSMQSGWLASIFGALLFGVLFVGTFYLLLISGTLTNQDGDISDISDLMSLFAEGYGGKRFYWYLPFFAISAHVFYLFVGWLKDVQLARPFSGTDVQSIVLVGMIVAFLPYFVNRFDAQNLWIPVLLYLLLVLPNMSDRGFGGRFAVVAFVIIVIAPTLLEKSNLFIKNSKRMWTLDRSDACLDGFATSDYLCSYMKGKAAELRQMAQSGNVVWISGTPLSLSRLSHVAPSLSRADPFAYARTEQHHETLVAEAAGLSPNLIMVDRADFLDPTGVPEQAAHWQQRLLNDLGYEVVRKSDYWIYAEKPQ